MKSLIKRYKAEFQTDVEEAKPVVAGRSSEERLVEALLQATTKKPTALEHIDMYKEMAQLNLDAHFPIASWPGLSETSRCCLR